METINNVAAAAAKAVWGESETNKEPVSGAQGDLSKGEPFDAGNLGTEKQSKLDAGTGDTPSNNTTGSSVTGNLGNLGNTGNITGDTLGDGSTTGFSTSTATSAGAVGSSDNTVEAKPAVAADTTSAQNDVRRPEDTSTNEDIHGQVRDEPGPKSLGTVAQEKGGDAGNTQGGPTNTETSGGSAGKDKDGESEGTGEQWVKTTGFQADGGDFDATKPGAGREADRLLEQKGIHKDPSSKPTPDSGDKHKDSSHGSKSSSGDGDKPSLGDRIKAKLHKN